MEKYMHGSRVLFTRYESVRAFSLTGIVYKYTIGFGVEKLLGLLDRKVLYRVDPVFASEQNV